MTVEGFAQLRPAGLLALVFHAELVADSSEELPRREHRIEDQGHVDAWREPIEEQATHRRLAVAGLTGEMHEPTRRLNAAEQVRDRLLVAGAPVKEAGGGRGRGQPVPAAQVRAG